MSIQNINVNAYQREFGGNREAHQLWSNLIHDIASALMPSLQVHTLDFYRMSGGTHRFNAGCPLDRMIVIGNSTFADESPNENSIEIDINDLNFDIEGLLPPRQGDQDVLITADNDVVIAEYNKRYNEVSILFDLFSFAHDVGAPILKHIFQKLEEVVFYPETLKNSWVNSQEKDALIERFQGRIKRVTEEQIRYKKNELEQIEADTRAYTQRLRDWHARAIILRRDIGVEDETGQQAVAKFMHDIDLVVNHEKVKDVHIVDGKFKVFTENIYMYASNTGKRYHLGEMRIDINIDHADIRFHNITNPREGFWTRNSGVKDPHPHVNGRTGEACLGNVAGTLAELCAQNEFYALVLMCIDFLENANQDDSAGMYVVKWDEVDEEGNIVVTAEEANADRDTFFCEMCDEDHFDDEREPCQVYGALDENGDPTDEHWVCEDARGDHYYYSERLGVYLHDDVEEPEEEDEA